MRYYFYFLCGALGLLGSYVGISLGLEVGPTVALVFLFYVTALLAGEESRND